MNSAAADVSVTLLDVEVAARGETEIGVIGRDTSETISGSRENSACCPVVHSLEEATTSVGCPSGCRDSVVDRVSAVGGGSCQGEIETIGTRRLVVDDGNPVSGSIGLEFKSFGKLSKRKDQIVLRSSTEDLCENAAGAGPELRPSISGVVSGSDSQPVHEVLGWDHLVGELLNTFTVEPESDILGLESTLSAIFNTDGIPSVRGSGELSLQPDGVGLHEVTDEVVQIREISTTTDLEGERIGTKASRRETGVSIDESPGNSGSVSGNGGSFDRTVKGGGRGTVRDISVLPDGPLGFDLTLEDGPQSILSTTGSRSPVSRCVTGSDWRNTRVISGGSVEGTDDLEKIGRAHV